jgi:hypothetical protein
LPGTLYECFKEGTLPAREEEEAAPEELMMKEVF